MVSARGVTMLRLNGLVRLKANIGQGVLRAPEILTL